MPIMSEEDKDLIRRTSGLGGNLHQWKKQPTLISLPSNNRPEMRNQKTGVEKSQTPYTRNRLADNIRGATGKGPSALTAGNPNTTRSVFTSQESKRRKTQETSYPRDPGPSGLLERGFLDKQIDLTKDDAEPVSHNLDDSDDSLNLKSGKHPRLRIAGDGPDTQRLKAGRRGGESSKAVKSDPDTDAITEYTAKEERIVPNLIRKFEGNDRKSLDSNGRDLHIPKLPLEEGNPLKPLVNHKPKAKSNRTNFGPTLFIQKPKAKGKDAHHLPLTDWVRGTERLVEPREHFLSWRVEDGKPILEVTSAKGHREFKINMKSEVKSLQAALPGESLLIIIFDVSELPQNPALGSLVPGSDGPHGVMAFRVDTGDKTCNQPARKSLYAFLKDKCGCKLWLSAGNIKSAWDGIVRGLDSPVTPQLKERKPSPSTIPNTDHGHERHRSVSSHPELPPSIKLSPPPGGEVPLPPKALQKAKQMHLNQIIEEQRDTREATEDEPIAGPSNRPLRRSSRQSTLHSSFSTIDPTHTSPSEDPDELLLVYRPLGTGAVNITRGDLERLQPGKYLNDTLIEFGLKLWLNNLRDHDPELADQIHLFSSFFYKKLAIKDKRAGYESVRKWTSRVDVFSKKYLVVPINEHLHWYLAIIYQPGYTLRPAPPSDSPVTRKRKRDEEPSVDSAVEASESIETPTTVSKPTSKIMAKIPEGGEVETVPDSEPSSPKMEVEEQTQTDETTKPEEREVEIQLCAEVSSVSLDEHEQERTDSRNSERDGSAHVSCVEMECMEIDHSPPRSPMHIDRKVPIEDLTREFTPHGTVEPSVVGTEDTASEAPAVEMEDSFDPNTIDAQSFYGTAAAPFRTYGNNKPRVSAPAKLEGGTNGEGPGDIETAPLEADHTYIFVFDSLNGKHPGAMKNLAQYLRFEATDKKGIENPSSPEAMIAHVPTQDNYCDCGLYLLHFAKVFMEDPAKSFQTILTKRKTPKADREVDWKKELVGTSREDLTRRILELGEVWVKERTKEAEEKAKAKEREGTSKPESIAVDSPEDSDDDVILEEVVAPKPNPPKKPVARRPEPTKKGGAARSRGRTSPKTETGPVEPERSAAERLR